ncbi:DUF1652 domain-containing protein [Pseudomonas mandelii]|uniref:DUF1652 domain-containing protein n=1 Tax=Pseudomonas mandelii TaxID=75612 RepID=UPI003F63E837
MVPISVLCNIVESGFKPLSCECTVNPNGLLRIKVYDRATGRIDLLIPCVTRSGGAVVAMAKAVSPEHPRSPAATKSRYGWFRGSNSSIIFKQ